MRLRAVMALAGTRLIEIQCKSLLNRVDAPSMGFCWSVNPYRGCAHACVYCYARRYHEYLELGPGKDFEQQILVKVNAVEVLRRELARRSWNRELVAIGTAVDPYQPAEGRYRLTRGILEALADYATPASVVTKNSMILRDLDVLQRLAQGPGVTVAFSITTLNAAVARRIEPDTPPPLQRLRVMQRLVEAGVRAGVLIAPILPGLTDDAHSLNAVIRAARDHGASFVSAGVLRLQGSVKEVYRQFLEEEVPWLLPLYERLYPAAYAPRAYQDRILRRVQQLKHRHGFRSREGTAPRRTAGHDPQGAAPVQLTLFAFAGPQPSPPAVGARRTVGAARPLAAPVP
ncbi:MAG: radical SAM protein [Limnochordales bacterium]